MIMNIHRHQERTMIDQKTLISSLYTRIYLPLRLCMGYDKPMTLTQAALMITGCDESKPYYYHCLHVDQMNIDKKYQW